MCRAFRDLLAKCLTLQLTFQDCPICFQIPCYKRLYITGSAVALHCCKVFWGRWKRENGFVIKSLNSRHTSRPRPRLLARGSRPSVRPSESVLECSRDSKRGLCFCPGNNCVCVIEQHTDVGRFARGEFIAFTWAFSVPQVARSHRRLPQNRPSLTGRWKQVVVRKTWFLVDTLCYGYGQ